MKDYTWLPGEKILVSEEGDVNILSPKDLDNLQWAKDFMKNYERKNKK